MRSFGLEHTGDLVASFTKYQHCIFVSMTAGETLAKAHAQSAQVTQLALLSCITSGSSTSANDLVLCHVSRLKVAAASHLLQAENLSQMRACTAQSWRLRLRAQRYDRRVPNWFMGIAEHSGTLRHSARALTHLF